MRGVIAGALLAVLMGCASYQFPEPVLVSTPGKSPAQIVRAAEYFMVREFMAAGIQTQYIDVVGGKLLIKARVPVSLDGGIYPYSAVIDIQAGPGRYSIGWTGDDLNQLMPRGRAAIEARMEKLMEDLKRHIAKK